MRCRRLGGLPLLLLAAAIVATMSATVRAQSSSSASNTGVAGVAIDAEGVLRTRFYEDFGKEIKKERIAAAKSALDPKVTVPSKLRKVSLNRLEQVILDHQGTLTDEMRHLAGLLRVRYVFYYPESKDIVLAGPAEGWVADVSGRLVGMTSGRPVLQLQDLAVALRAFPPSGKSTSMIGCSIDPTPEGLAAMKQFVSGVRLGGAPSEEQVQAIAEGVRTSLGLQTISIHGVSARTHFAQVLVEADYRMKLIGIGLERPPVKLVSYVDRAKLTDIARNALQRWYFLPDYKCVRQSDDRLAMELVGDGVKLIGEDEMVTEGGERKVAAGKGNKASHAFVANFTAKYAELADRSPVYAELRNLIDLAVVSAYIQAEGYYDKAGWKMEFLGSESLFPVETYDVPKTVESAVRAVWKGNVIGTPVGGGVKIEATEAIEGSNLLPDQKARVSKLREDIKPQLAKGQWWWD
ncbi:MAG: DUF1598 domain-containing protein [Planctomycetaceae bacterium]|nr:DUF1598 domain-containing protein [Planctomycetaceae bacterium]